MSLFFSTTPIPSSQEEGTTGSDFSSIILILTLPRTACECPSSDFCLRTPRLFCPDYQRMPRSFFSGRHGGLPLRLDASLSPLPLFSDEKTPFLLPQNCISDASQTHYKDTKKS